MKTGSFWKFVAFFVWVVLCLFLLPRGGWKEGLRRECWLEPLLVPMRLDGDATTVAASPASESLWGVVGLIQQARDRSPLSVARIAEREREEVVVRRREESRRREEEKRERALQERKREGKVHNRDEKRTQSSPVPLMTVVVVPPSPPSPSPRFIVGYALTSKKIKSFIQPKFESHARYRKFEEERSAMFYFSCNENPSSGFASVATMLCTQQNPRKLLLECLLACLLVFSAAKLGMKLFLVALTRRRNCVCMWDTVQRGYHLWQSIATNCSQNRAPLTSSFIRWVSDSHRARTLSSFLSSFSLMQSDLNILDRRVCLRIASSLCDIVCLQGQWYEHLYAEVLVMDRASKWHFPLLVQ